MAREWVTPEFVSDKRLADIPNDVLPHVTVATKSREIPTTARVVLGVSHKFGVKGEYDRMVGQLAAAGNGERPFDVLFVDEAWQLPLHLYSRVTGYAPIVVGVGDVGQLPPIDPGQNPWRGDHGYNPYRAWPTAYEKDDKTVAVDLPAVWRPTAEQLPLWRAFYSDWDALHCVAAPGDRTFEFPTLPEPAHSVWTSVATGVPTLLEVDGLPDPDAPTSTHPCSASSRRSWSHSSKPASPPPRPVTTEPANPSPPCGSTPPHPPTTH